MRVGKRLLVATVVLLALVVGSVALAQGARADEKRPTAGSGGKPPACTATRIRGFTDNRTGLRMQLLQVGNGIHDVWCDEPEDAVSARGADRSWLVGDTMGAVDVNLLYRLENGDEIRYIARLKQPDTVQVGCSYVDVVSTRAEYECFAEVVGGASEVAFVRFVVRPSPG